MVADDQGRECEGGLNGHYGRYARRGLWLRLDPHALISLHEVCPDRLHGRGTRAISFVLDRAAGVSLRHVNDRESALLGLLAPLLGGTLMASLAVAEGPMKGRTSCASSLINCTSCRS